MSRNVNGLTARLRKGKRMFTAPRRGVMPIHLMDNVGTQVIKYKYVNLEQLVTVNQKLVFRILLLKVVPTNFVQLKRIKANMVVPYHL